HETGPPARPQPPPPPEDAHPPPGRSTRLPAEQRLDGHLALSFNTHEGDSLVGVFLLTLHRHTGSRDHPDRPPFDTQQVQVAICICFRILTRCLNNATAVVFPIWSKNRTPRCKESAATRISPLTCTNNSRGSDLPAAFDTWHTAT